MMTSASSSSSITHDDDSPQVRDIYVLTANT